MIFDQSQPIELKPRLKLMALNICVLFLLCATSFLRAQTVSLNGTNYSLQPHPRVFINSALNTRIAYSNGNVAPKAVSSNPAWVALGLSAANFYSSYPYNNLNYASRYMDGSIALLYAQYWYSDNSQTQYLTAALYLLNNIQQYVPLVCIETVQECVNGGAGLWAGTYGPAYYMPNWIYAYELVRSQMTATQQQTFADKFLNDLSLWGGTGLGGSASTSCSNPTVNNTSINVTISSSGVITASAALFGSGNQIQMGDWIYESTNAYGGVIASVTNSTTATIESDMAYAVSGYSGTLFSRRSAWNNGDCGWFWLQKHDWYAPYVIIQSTTAYPSPGGYGQYGGINAESDPTDNLVLSQTYGDLASLLSLANDDVNFSSRDSVELTDLYNFWYTTLWQGMEETVYTGFTPTGSVYGVWRASTFYPMTAYEVMNSVVSPPPLTAGIWAKNFAHHFYLDTFPACPAQEMQYGQSFPVDSSYNSYMPWVPGMAGLVTIFEGTNEGEYLNYWMQNIWDDCVSASGTLPKSKPMWSSSNLQGDLNNAYQPWFYLYSDPAYPTNSNLPTGSVDNYADNASSTSGTPMAGMMSRTGYSTVTDTLVMYYALAVNGGIDHDLPDGGFYPADYRIFKGSFLLADDDSQGAYNAGGPFSSAMEIGGDSNISSSTPWIDKMPVGHSDANYTFACTDSTLSYLAAANASAVYRCVVHFKEASTQDFVVASDYVASSSGNTKQTYLHYPQTAYTGGSCTTSTGSTSFDAAAGSVTSTFDGTASISNVDEAQLLTSILTPNSSIPVYAYVQNSNGTYTGGNGCTFRVSLCAATTSQPSTCNASNTTAEFAVVHEPVAGSGDTMPATAMLTTIDGNHRGIEINGTSPKVFVYPITMLASTDTSATFTTTHSGIAQYVVAGLAAGTYNVTVNGSSVVSGATVSTGDTTLYFESTSGAVAVSQTGSTAATPTFSPAAGTYSSAQTVTISDSTSGSTIYYTTNGSTPTTNSAVYSSPITVSATETVEAIATASGYSESAVGSAAYTIGTPTVATPTFNPAAGSYGPAQSVTISDSTSGATIYYTTNGTTPTTVSTTYSSAITVSVTQTLRAIAAESGYTTSAVASAAYTINGAAATPTFSPAAGTYSSSQSVTISDGTSGATIYYTTNGSTPTTASATYSSAITVSTTETLEAIAAKSGFSNSAVASAAYTISSGSGTPAFVQQCSSYGNYVSTVSCTLNGIGSGHALVIGVYVSNSYTPTVTATTGTPSSVISNLADYQGSMDTYILANTASGNNTITATTSSAENIWITASEYSGVATSSPLDTSATASEVGSWDSTTVSTGNFTTTGANDLLWSMCYGIPSYVQWSAGTTPITWIAANSNSTAGVIAEYGEAASAGTYYGQCATTTTNGGADYASIMTVALKSGSGTPTAATPTFSPAAGAYGPAQSVTISDSTSGSTIYYTTNGTTPTTASATYSSAITVSATGTVEAIATASGYAQSAVGSAAYTINGAVTTPSFSPVAGTYSSTQTVTISDGTSGSTIYYTTNGTTPTTASATYSSVITVSSTETLEAIAAKTGYSNSAVGSAVYTIGSAAATPTFSPTAGAYGPAQTVTISDSTPGSTIYYTTNGTTPTTSSTKYTSTITVSSTETLEAIATASGYSQSAVGSAVYTINGAAATPAFSPTAGTYTTSQTVTISDGTSGATIYYTTNGTTPTTSSTKYTSAVTVSATETLEAIATDTGYSNSAVSSAIYILQVATPTFSPAAGTYSSAQTVTISDSTSGSTIYYTTNGTTPTTSSTKYTSAITVSATQTLEAIATDSGHSNSAVGSAAYTIGASNPAYVQQCSQYTAGNGNSESAACTLNGVKAGDALMIGVWTIDATLSSVTSSTGTPASVISSYAGGSGYLSAYLLSNAASGNITITATETGYYDPVWISVVEFTNVATSPLDVSGTGSTGNSNYSPSAVSSSNFTTTAANDILWSFCTGLSGDTFTVGTAPISWTQLLSSSNYAVEYVEDGLATTAGTYYGQCYKSSVGYDQDILAVALKP